MVLGKEGAQYRSRLVAQDVNLISVDSLPGPTLCTVKVRYQATPSPACLTPLPDGRVQVEFETPQRSVTPGQAVVFYDGDLVLGGGTIV